ncbi:hypothetical protein ES702_01704 [subsurface metagenome]
MAISEEKLLLHLPKKLKDEIRAEAKRKHLTLNSVIRLGISEWLREQALKYAAEKRAK